MAFRISAQNCDETAPTNPLDYLCGQRGGRTGNPALNDERFCAVVLRRPRLRYSPRMRFDLAINA
jgi:hypothetical protein